MANDFILVSVCHYFIFSYLSDCLTVDFRKDGLKMKKFFAVLLFLISLCGYSYADEQSVTNNQRELTMQVDEMNCQLCVYLVNKELRSIEGVLKTKADMNAHTVKVITTDKVSNEQLIKAMEKLHYHAKVL